MKNSGIEMREYDYIAVGAGLAGSIIARRLAEDKGKKTLVLERRDHIGGNTYDFRDPHGIRVQKYGPHVIHTNDEQVRRFITRFCEPEDYRTKCEAVINGTSTPSPFNFKTIDQFYGAEEAAALKNRLISYYEGRPSVTVVELLEAEDDDIRGFAEFLFENDYRPYTAKQWALDPSEIDPSVLKRVPVVLSYGDTYFYDKYEFIPKNGFEELARSILDHPNIEVRCKTDALELISFDEADGRVLFDNRDCRLIYTGAVDELFQYRFGVLPYRSLHFDFRSVQQKSFQNTAIVAYPQEPGFTRITEYTKMPYQEGGGWTCVAYEYPVPYDIRAEKGNEPYYPVLTEESKAAYERYRAYAERFPGLTLCGRLAEFKYYNMDQVILRALEVSEELEKRI